MLVYILAIAIAALSLIIFGTAFFASELHRKDDFLWSGVGLFYALVLWVCAESMRGAVLLGQTAATILLISFGWQTLKLRKATANPDKIAEIESFSVLEWLQNRIAKKKSSQPVAVAPPEASVESPSETVEEEVVETSTVEATETVVEKPETSSAESTSIEADETSSQEQEETQEEEAAAEATETATSPPPSQVAEKSPAKSKFSFGKLFSFGRQKTTKPSTPQSQTLNAALDSAETETDIDETDEEWESEETVSSSESVTVEESQQEESQAETPPSVEEVSSVIETVAEAQTESQIQTTDAAEESETLTDSEAEEETIPVEAATSESQSSTTTTSETEVDPENTTDKPSELNKTEPETPTTEKSPEE